MTKRKSTSTTRKSAGDIHCTVKRHGHLEKYDERKVYASIYAACASAHTSHRDSEKIAAKICKVITALMKKKKTVDSEVIHTTVAKELKKHNDDAAFMYDTHRDIS